MSVKLIAVDMDGTFLNSNGQYNKSRFRELYQQLLQRGIKFVVASGNQYYQLKSFFDDIDDQIAYVAENGGYIVDKMQEVYCGNLPSAQVAQVLECISTLSGVNFLVCGKKGAYMLETGDPDFFTGMRTYYHHLDTVADYTQIDDVIFKFALSYEEDDVSGLMDEITQKIGDIVTTVSSGHGSVDLIIPGNHKANGIKRIQRIYGIADNEVMALGDGGNDLEMLRHAGYGFAMKNGSPAAKQAAEYLAPTNDDEGVLKIIDDCLNNRPPFDLVTQ